MSTGATRAVRLTRWGGPPILTETARPVPRGEEVLIEVEAAGLCRSDLHVIDAGPGALPYRLPFTLGHEVAGRVAQRGPSAVGPAVGERVVVHGPWGCGSCARCGTGAENYCDRRTALDADRVGTGAGLGRDGGMADAMLVPSGRVLVPVGDLAAEQAAPLSDAGLTAYHSVAMIRPALGEDEGVVVIGVGGLGHLAVQILRATTSARVLAVDVREEALALADACGAHFGTLLRPDTAAALRSRTGGAGAVAVLDFVGSRSSLELAVDVLRPGGELVVVGSGGGELTVRKPGALPPGTRISLPFWGTRPELEAVVSLARDGVLTVGVEPFGLSQATEAVARLREGRVRGRAVLTPD
ncbi:NAD(P)-dependent alcohol dehydrogenase [Streptomyces griseorubiginosus]|uniref:NAD(P)-dependent alcohol dehydrogenase n=1 Tax=Streptomyces griseorubiginosus TaxID=67304 RepID=UPI002E81CCD0|nr:NAD(P)-dependent alcohol dehydrogenase [Streptomyces griseorubiginosus]WUB41840.1 NAD(P)-dependent alcohol dehydrogenase [Streptomyces griseorubiginosus]WUB50360.1 NAD(P)-dependent alcohol dehydrogenase [Streptomyces griseorubiginosus]